MHVILPRQVLGKVFVNRTAGALERHQAFEGSILQPLLGGQYLLKGRLCRLPPAFQAALLVLLQLKGRHGTTEISSEALLLPDLTLFSGSACSASGTLACCGVQHAEQRQLEDQGTCSEAAQDAQSLGQGRHSSSPARCLAVDAHACICVELKPKCGFLPTSPCIRHPMQRRVSRYQLHQRLKLAQGSISALSSYDPLDLFSGDEQRMEAALAALLAQPQNNLRLFWRGSAVVPQERFASSGALESFGGAPGLIRLLRTVLQREGEALALLLWTAIGSAKRLEWKAKTRVCLQACLKDCWQPRCWTATVWRLCTCCCSACCSAAEQMIKEMCSMMDACQRGMQPQQKLLQQKTTAMRHRTTCSAC